MKISEYIRILETIEAEHGDLEVEDNDADGGRTTARSPVVAHQLILTARESKQRFWSEYQGLVRRGKKVCKV